MPATPILDRFSHGALRHIPGGCCSYVDLIWGIKEFVAEADRLADKYGDRFRPNDMLRDMAAKGEGFYDRFAPADMVAAA